MSDNDTFLPEENPRNMIGVLMYLFKYHMREDCALDMPLDALFAELVEEEYDELAIERAFNWIESLKELQEDSMQYAFANSKSMRVYTQLELRKIDRASLNFLSELINNNIIQEIDRETIIYLGLGLDMDTVTLPIIKWVTMMVLFNQPNGKQALAYIEAMVLKETPEEAH